MRLLIDECIDERLRLLFPTHACHTVRGAKLAGLTNGHLLEAAEAAGFEVLITVDQPRSRSTELERAKDVCVDSLRTRQPSA
jgi:hypothetical protein